MDKEIFSITQNGNPLNESEYSIDLETKTFYTSQGGLVLDFNRLSNWTFTTGGSCTFETYDDCTFTTGNDCLFHTVANCIFKTGNGCIFKTGANCTFDTKAQCTFLLYDIQTCKFNNFDGHSIVLDRMDNKRYLLNEEFQKLMKVLRG